MSWRLWLPFLLFFGFAGLAAYQLSQPKDDTIKSTMVGKELPYFTLPPASLERPGVDSRYFYEGEPKLLNIWASWCLPCIAEAAQLEQLKDEGVEIVGVAIRDEPTDVMRFLTQHGNPYTRIGRDDLSEVQLAIGSSGVPETFVIDGKGVITYQHVGDIRHEHVPMLLEELRKAGR
ncbi:DsbE family thiol:disulfide interchange protein [Erythrobacter sp. SD-21]|uniref:DsbE family thiol:disulfide interchange protein n=1 Tax=Erythrobacter sp. SD-21 TaxID=161528 RepID=UPI000153FD75|nr:DsbE family thiol:disulfide interchange protein [Erythrobacter sp. SD-21]EDL47950.1 cytochrome c biogenesis protein [Erythrobacter sp. SD-21]